MNTYTLFLLDDNEVFLSFFQPMLADYLETLPYSFDIYAFTDPESMLTQAAIVQPDLIFADILLADPVQNGISVMENLRKSGCTADIIFLTDFLNYATDVFGVQPLYFILKTEADKRIPEAMSLFLRDIGRRETMVSLKMRKAEEVISAERILFVERCMRKTIVHCKGETFTVSTPLRVLISQLPKNEFAFSHQSILVNLRHVKSFGSSSLKLLSGEELPISRLHSDLFRQAMALYLSES